ncbi:hypothetical protein A1O7_02261 [Cladophialophora yegresii CBS 114405]|uniref:Uncharacterized protein n=1 Tax=Cladophialophora yegresii CBS 114405 TaxID=1182544 RepID=W9WBB9_9EURO|nr:uncharacterized protein A1O7_02261 [Cladophialophora yegresii CBS 114405]EXJ61831.1 hypothetical protein A1O7_02261 [Cladophialophora yegresii CBS 114405]
MADISPTDPNHPWVARGYRPEFAYSVRKAPVQDPHGEIAYQRAFVEAAEAKYSRAEGRLCRVPDPLLYYNSPSARDYIKRRDDAIFSAKPRNGNPMSSTQPNTPSSIGTPMYSPGRRASPNYSANGGSTGRRTSVKSDIEPALSIANSSPNTRTADQVSPRPSRPHAEQYQPYAPKGLPLTLEPKLDAPAGPSRMLR